MSIPRTCLRSLPLAIGAALGLVLAAPPSARAQSDAPKPAAAAPVDVAAKKTRELKPRHVDAAGAAKLLKKDDKVVVIDVRTPGEFAEGHIADARNIDFNSPDFAAELGKLDRSKTYLVHCAAGGRSTRSLAAFKKLGFQSVVHLDGGFSGWAKAGKPVKK